MKLTQNHPDIMFFLYIYPNSDTANRHPETTRNTSQKLLLLESLMLTLYILMLLSLAYCLLATYSYTDVFFYRSFLYISFLLVCTESSSPTACLPTVRWKEKYRAAWSMRGCLNITHTAFQCVLLYLTRFLAVAHFAWVVRRLPPSENTQGRFSAKTSFFKRSSNYYFYYDVDNAVSVRGTAQTAAIHTPVPSLAAWRNGVLRNQKQELFGPLTSMGTHTTKLKQLERNHSAENPIWW